MSDNNNKKKKIYNKETSFVAVNIDIEKEKINNNNSQQQEPQKANDVKDNEFLIDKMGDANVVIDIDEETASFDFFLEKEQIKQQENVKTDFVTPSVFKAQDKDEKDDNTNYQDVNCIVNLTARTSTTVSMNFKQVERKFIGHLTRHGERSKAVRIWLRFLIFLKRHFYNSPIKCNVQEIILTVIDIIKPLVILKERKIAGTVYQIPYFVQNVSKDNATLIAIRWLIEATDLRLEHDPAERLYKEFLDVLKLQGICHKKKQDIYAIAIKNRVYAKFLFLKSGKRRNI